MVSVPGQPGGLAELVLAEPTWMLEPGGLMRMRGQAMVHLIARPAALQDALRGSGGWFSVSEICQRECPHAIGVVLGVSHGSCFERR